MRFQTSLAILASLALAVTAGAQTKTSGALQCTQATDAPKPMDAGDAPGHMMGVGKSTCTWSTPMEISGLKTKEGTSVSFDEMTGAKYSGRGTHRRSSFATEDPGARRRSSVRLDDYRVRDQDCPQDSRLRLEPCEL